MTARGLRIIRCFVSLLLLFVSVPVQALAPAFLVHTMAGAVAGSAGAIAVYPIDYVKSQLQTEEGRAKYSSGLEAAIDIIRASPQGPLALYRGVLVNIIGIAPEKTIKLSANDMARMAILGHFGYLPILGEVLAGGIAGMTQVIVTNPLEVIKVRMQTSDMSVKDIFSQIHSVADLYKGATACIVRDALFSAILFPLYAHAKVAVAAGFMAATGFWAEAPPSFLVDLIAGSAAALPAALLSTPADVVKTRIQQAKRPGVDSDEETKEFLDVAKMVVDEEGMEVLFSGSFERVARSVPQFGVTLAMFDVVSDFAAANGWM